MRCWHHSVWSVALAVVTATLGTSVTEAQELALAERGPRFLFAAAPSAAPKPVDIRRTPVLRQRIALDVDGATLTEALAEITRQSGLAFVYSRDVVSAESRVHLRAEQITVAAALTEILLDAGVDVLLSSGGQAALVKRTEVAVAQPGSIAGRVTDAKTGQGLEGTEVLVDGTRWRTLTGTDGQYRLADIDTGSYTVTARRIGYTRQSRSVTVVEGQETTADFALHATVTKLDELVTTGTMVPTEVKALPTPMSVISERDIELQRPRTIQQLFRQEVTGAVSWDLANNYYITPFSTRGSTTLTGGTSGMKVFVDGVQTALSSVSGLDPNSIERIEVIRGPQAAAIYGTDAIGGVIQYFTKRGDPSLAHPQLTGEAALGLVQTPYSGVGTVVRQNYRAAIRGGGSDVSYHLGGGYWHINDYLPNGEISRQSNPSAYGGMRFARGMISVDLSGRYYLQEFGGADNPELAQTGWSFVSKPFYQPQQVVNQTVGARFGVAPTSWWQHALMVGFDRYTIDYARARPRLTTASDTLLQMYNQHQTRTSIGYNTSVQGVLGSGISGSIAAGFDHYSLPSTIFFTGGALNTTGVIQFAPGQTPYFSRTLTHNTGYFVQGQLGLRDALFLTGALRAESNSDFGDSLGTPISPRVGVSFVRPVGGVTFKVRGAWGRAIKAPAPGLKNAVLTSFGVTLANPLLGPERQQGWDGGIDVVFGPHGTLGVTYFHQTAENLIQSVLFPSDSVRTDQYQNVARVKNTGIEVEGRMSIGPLDLRSQYAYTRARVERLAPGYAGDLQVGDQTPNTPKHTAGISVSVLPFSGTSLSAGLTHVGSWRNFDFFAFYGCFGGTRPCQPSTRGYVIDYPSFTKLNATASQRLTRLFSGFISVDNLTNTTAYELSNAQAVMGRITTLGFQFRH